MKIELITLTINENSDEPALKHSLIRVCPAHTHTWYEGRL